MKVPPTPPAELIASAQHIRTYEGLLWRIYRTAGAHALRWDELRRYGPVPGMRFDPHPLPIGVHPNAGVMYTSTTADTAFAETFHSSRVIDRTTARPALVAWQATRPLELLDLTSFWPIQNGAAASIMMGAKAHTQAWARAIDTQLVGRIDGLFHLSSLTSDPMVTLFDRATRQNAFPRRPAFRAILADSAADEIVLKMSESLNFDVC